MSRRGRLIAIEGIDGSGKSTQAHLLAERTGALLTREPGSTPLGSILREALLSPDTVHISPRAEALLMAADRAEHVAQVIEPALARGDWVVCDRYSASTMAYQGHGRGLPLGELASVIGFATGGIEADLNVLLEIPPGLARARIGLSGSSADRFEALGEAFFERVAQGYASMAAAEPASWLRLDATGTEEAIAEMLLAEVTRRLGTPPKPR